MSDTPEQDGATVRSYRDITAGLIFLALAIAFGWESTNYEMGRPVRMGPGFIPLALALMLGALGLAVMLTGLNKHGEGDSGPVPWRGIALVGVALVLFGAFGRELGLVPVVFLCSFVTALASVRNTLSSALGISAALAVVCWVVFKLGLGISLSTIGPVFGPLQIF
ncbi:tripartite tricarboxylate transporter TctB family protein [Ancylobacter defluvii]|uniref:Membrane protein n=1 Tax=Ancylobacter defluvii TaxID=1282440 RepID=A0A9W6JT98_9HYPH|nr:tripartite tricarboxylate transporter TctB family protein [Ancylobacter defluvii]MBS7590211.1 tripartite tricarboxylate transporter TctB family protein [Ancylobacter defluvii]GLK82852.1 membrane protein [Ancylobacter defluvii]